jgi:hypothetical protein
MSLIVICLKKVDAWRCEMAFLVFIYRIANSHTIYLTI